MPALQQTLSIHTTYLCSYGQGHLPSRRGKQVFTTRSKHVTECYGPLTLEPPRWLAGPPRDHPQASAYCQRQGSCTAPPHQSLISQQRKLPSDVGDVGFPCGTCKLTV